MTPKKIAVLGGGNGAHTMAAEFALKGHTVNLYEMPQFKNNMKKVFETKTIHLQGNIKELQGPVTLNMVTDDIARWRAAAISALWPPRLRILITQSC